ncbi:MAG: LysR family transcriptional regulator [Lentisphaeraceae bacterium]|nr:LysR family transcriptional regulator [Lentisphaeraceae bacterium]
MDITLRQLEVFVAVARCGSVSKAASELYLSQPAASMAIGELEKLLGDRFFDRKGRKLFLNEKGRALLPLSVDVINRIDEIQRKFNRNSNEPTGIFKLGSSTTIGSYVLPELLNVFLREFPEIEVSVKVQNTELIINQILDFDLDMAIIEGTCHNSAIEVIPWRKDHLAVFCAPGHPLAKKEQVTPRDLCDAGWVLREAGSGSRAIFENAITGVVNNLNVTLELGSTEAVKRAVESGIGISCLSIHAIERQLKHKELVELKTPFIDLGRYYYILVHKKKYRNQLLHSCLEFWDRHSTLKGK